ncbi:hypothetical protein J421_2005 [Gemmatirosa kalamazoonensis]|uniref:Uncharacterized protein n=1 Tax=Gemmatirosa kalamazoonensis TaxID=861299 RepID=W0RGH7_9BACT|nr:hypothetical protein J421_2005 [Gemmatirosa kalamazoonensis]
MLAIRSSHSRAAVVFTTFAISGAAASGCVPSSGQTVTITQLVDTVPVAPTPAPTWAAGYALLTTDAARNAWLADSVPNYGRSLAFDTVDGAGDEQRLMVDSTGLGPQARIEPQIGAFKLADVTLGAGRVIARLINTSGTASYTFLAMQPNDTVYWWVERRSQRWVGAIVSVKSGNGKFIDSVTMTNHGVYTWKQSLSRWQPVLLYAAPWGTCENSVCCGTTQAKIAAAITLK